jgi:GxxExxY protein
MVEILYKEESFRIIGACMMVHSKLGPGFLEAVYQEALEKEFTLQDIPYKRQPKLSVYYNGEKLKKYYIADFLCYNAIIVEIKATAFLINANQEQLSNSLRATNLKLGLLVNFGQPSLVYKRLINVSLNS